jgi:hypothetical protein
MSSQQSMLIVELAETLQWLPSSARVLAWCRLLNSAEALLDANIAEPLIALIPYLKDVGAKDFARYHDLFVNLIRRVPEENKKKVYMMLKNNKSVLPAPLKADLSFGELIFGA